MIHFTKHALEKFEILRRHKFILSKTDVINAIQNPEIVDYSRHPLKIAQRSFDKTHILRVVYKEEYGNKIIITFYPAGKSQYEKRK